MTSAKRPRRIPGQTGPGSGRGTVEVVDRVIVVEKPVPVVERVEVPMAPKRGDWPELLRDLAGQMTPAVSTTEISPTWRRVSRSRLGRITREARPPSAPDAPDNVSALLGVPVATLCRWHSATSPGHPIGPKAFRVGRHLRYAADDATAYIDRLRGSAS